MLQLLRYILFAATALAGSWSLTGDGYAGATDATLGKDAQPSVEKGKRIARLHCARCHVVGEFNRMGGISSTPSFYLLVRAFKDWRERFETFYARRPHPAFLSIKGQGRLRQDLPANAHPVVLERRAVADVIAYVETLRKKPARPKAVERQPVVKSTDKATN